MKLALFTSDQIRHRYFVNQLAPMADECLIFVEKKTERQLTHLITRHLLDQVKEEVRVFGDPPAFPVDVFDPELIKSFKPDLGIVFGYSIIPKEIIDLFPKGKLINLHLGLSPWYRGCATNFWPWVFDELGYLGATIHVLDEGVDTGDIMDQIRPYLNFNDTVHTVGCRIIHQSIGVLQRFIQDWESDWFFHQSEMVYSGELRRVCKRSDFNDAAILKYQENLKKGIVRKYL